MLTTPDRIEKAVVCVIDNDPQTQQILQDLLADLDIAIKAYSSAEAFLQDSSRLAPACIVVEHELPGISGLQLLETLNRRDSKVPVIVIASGADIITAVTAIQLHATDFIEKPFIKRLLRQRIVQILSAGRTA